MLSSMQMAVLVGPLSRNAKQKRGIYQVRRQTIACTMLMVASLGLCQAGARNQSFEHLFEGSPILAGEEGAWIVQEPKVVSAGPVEAFAFGPGPNEVVVAARSARALTPQTIGQGSQGRSSNSGFRLDIVNLLSGSVRRISLPSGLVGIDTIDWDFHKRIAQLYCRTSEKHITLLVDPASGTYYGTDGLELELMIPSELSTLAVLRTRNYGAPSEGEKLRIVDFSVNPPQSRHFQVPSKAGRPLFLTKNQTLVCEIDSGRSPAYAELRLSDGELKPWQKPAAEPEVLKRSHAVQALPIDIEYREGRKEGTWLTVRPGLRSELRLSKEADKVVMDEKGSRVLFRAHGAVFVSEITPFDLEAALKALMAYARTNALNMAKNAGTALQIYTADYDGVLPFSGASAKESVMPYIKSAKILDSVIWNNVTGQTLASISDPAGYELGYVPGPGGRAIIFADGSVGWRPDR